MTTPRTTTNYNCHIFCIVFLIFKAYIIRLTINLRFGAVVNPTIRCGGLAYRRVISVHQLVLSIECYSRSTHSNETDW